MIKFELIKDETFIGKRFLYSNTRWKESSNGFKTNKTIFKNDITEKLKNKLIKITCGEDQYFDIDLIKGKQIQYTGSSSDNFATKELYVYKNKPNEIYINPINDLIDMTNYDKLYREYIIKIVHNSQQKVEYHGIVLSLEYKNNGKIDNPDYDIDISLYQHELSRINFIPYTFDLSFAALSIYWVFDLSINKNLISLIDYSSITIITAYMVQLIYRTVFIKNTWLNFIFRLFKKKNRTTNKSKKWFTKRGFEQRIFNNYLVLKEETKNKKLTEL